MGDALGDSLLTGLIVIGFLVVTGGVALVSGLTALLIHGAAKTAAAWVFGISLGLFSLPALKLFVLDSLADMATSGQQDRKYKAERTPLIIAVENKDIGEIKRLIKKGVDVNEVKNSWTALNTAVNLDVNKSSSDYDEIVQILLEAGADANKVSGTGMKGTRYAGISLTHIPPIGIAIGSRREGAVRLLIEHGANIDRCTGNSFMPFHFAIWYANYEAAEILLNAGADINAADVEGKTPLMLTVTEIYDFENILRAVEFLTQHGADISLKDKDGKRALEMFTARYAGKELSDNQKENYDKITALLTPKVSSQKNSSPNVFSSEPTEIAYISLEKHRELDDILDNW